MRLNDLLARAKDRTPKDPAFEAAVAAAREQAERLAGPLRAQMGPAGAWDQVRLADLPLGQQLEGGTTELQRAAGILAQERLAAQQLTWDSTGARSVTVAYARKRLPWTAADVAVLLDAARGAKSDYYSDVYRLRARRRRTAAD